ncbi:hypothetical protein BU17DRAFT_70681 [Hysterangium stoloniferum]|nr:hypothetical protein BU17DRAFT_70681 [Hysterangium stoloniferum]
MVIKAMARNIGPLANVVILLLGVIYIVKILVHGTFIPRLSHYPQTAELIAHLRRFATHTLAVSIASYVNMCEYSLHMLLVVSWFPLHQWSILKFLSFVAEKIFGPSLLPVPVADVSSSSKFMALFKVMTGAKIEPYYANVLVSLLPVSISSQLMLRTCYRQSLAPVRGSLWKMLPAIPYMLAQSPMPADVVDQVISLFSSVEDSLVAEACPMVTSRITATFAYVVVTPLMVVYLRRPIWNVCHQALCLVARAAGMMLFWLLKIAATIVFKLLKIFLGCICTVSAYRSYSLADDLMSSPLVPILMCNPIAVRRVCILSSQLMLHTCYHQSLAPVRGSLWKILPAIPYVLAQSPMPADVIDQVISLFSGVGRSLEAEACPMVTSRITATFACVVVTALMVVYLHRPIWNICHQALCFVERAARMMLFGLLKIAATIVFKLPKFVLGCICTVSAYWSYSLADDLMSSPLVPILMMRNPIAVRRVCIHATTNSITTVSGAQQGAPESINEDKDEFFNEEMTRRMSASSNAKPTISTAAATEADPTPSATTKTAAEPTPSTTTDTAADPTPSTPTVPAADPTADSVDTLGLENINDDEDDIFIDEEITPAATTATAADPTPSGITAIAADPTPSGTTTIAGDLTPSATTTTATDPTPSAATAPAADPTANSVNTLGGAQQVAPENIIDDKNDIFIDEEITPAATTTTAAEPTPSGTTAIAVDPTPSSTTATADHIPPADTTASGGEGSEASMWAPGNQAVEFPTKEEINDIWSAFHAMKRETKEELAATAKPMASPSIDTTASSGEGLEASILAPGNQPVEYPAKEEQADIWGAFHAMKRQTKEEPAATAKPMASPSIDTSASGGEGLEASIWAPGNQPVEYPTKEEQADIWAAFHAMKRQTKGELVATAKPMASTSTDTAASDGEGLEASIWAPGNQPVECPTKEEQADIWGAFHAMKRQTKGELAAIAKPMASTSIDTAASDGEGLEASIWAPGNQPVECPTKEEQADIWATFHAMKRQTKEELVATAKPMASTSIDTAASDGDGLEASIWAPGNQPVEEQADLPASHSTKRRKAVSVSPVTRVGHFRHPPLANIGVEAYRADSRLDGAPAESIQTIPASYLGAYQLVRVNPAKGDPALM